MTHHAKRFYNLLIIITICACSITAAQAQQQRASEERSMTTKFGIKGGVNLTNLYVDEVKDENIKVGYQVGFMAKIPVVKMLSIQPELMYSSKGASVIYDNIVFGSGEYRYNLNYVEMPVSAVVNVLKNLSVHAGGYASFLVHANIKDVNKDGTVNGITEVNEGNFNRVDYGVLGGIAADVEKVTFGARYAYGLREIGKSDAEGGSRFTQGSKNSAFSLYIGFAF